MKEVQGKVAFITGGSSGIGLGIACAFAEAGMKIVIAIALPSISTMPWNISAGPKTMSTPSAST